jgi:Glycine rich protein
MGRCAHIRNVVCTSAAVALLVACGGNVGAPGGILEETVASAAFSHHQIFKYTGAKQAFTVPDGVTLIKIVALGARGGGGSKNQGAGGYGGRAAATFVVTPKEQMIVYVGGNGSGQSGGFNGGGSGGAGEGSSSDETLAGGGGGGASDVRTVLGELSDRILVAGGGGGQNRAKRKAALGSLIATVRLSAGLVNGAIGPVPAHDSRPPLGLRATR